jgi:hypothetical protein
VVIDSTEKIGLEKLQAAFQQACQATSSARAVSHMDMTVHIPAPSIKPAIIKGLFLFMASPDGHRLSSLAVVCIYNGRGQGISYHPEG